VSDNYNQRENNDSALSASAARTTLWLFWGKPHRLWDTPPYL